MRSQLDHPQPYEVLLAIEGEVCAERTKIILDHLSICPHCRKCIDVVESMISMFAATQGASVEYTQRETAAQASFGDRVLTCSRHAVTDDEGVEVERLQKRVKQRLREVYDHRPQALFVAVNGRPIAQLAIVRAVNRWTLPVEWPLEYIEVISEQGLCLLAMYVRADALCPPTELKQTTRLSRGRDLTLVVSQAIPRATLRVSYCVPSAAFH